MSGARPCLPCLPPRSTPPPPPPPCAEAALSESPALAGGVTVGAAGGIVAWPSEDEVADLRDAAATVPSACVIASIEGTASGASLRAGGRIVRREDARRFFPWWFARANLLGGGGAGGGASAATGHSSSGGGASRHGGGHESGGASGGWHHVSHSHGSHAEAAAELRTAMAKAAAAEVGAAVKAASAHFAAGLAEVRRARMRARARIVRGTLSSPSPAPAERPRWRRHCPLCSPRGLRGQRAPARLARCRRRGVRWRQRRRSKPRPQHWRWRPRERRPRHSVSRLVVGARGRTLRRAPELRRAVAAPGVRASGARGRGGRLASPWSSSLKLEPPTIGFHA